MAHRLGNSAWRKRWLLRCVCRHTDRTPHTLGCHRITCHATGRSRHNDGNRPSCLVEWFPPWQLIRVRLPSGRDITSYEPIRFVADKCRAGLYCGRLVKRSRALLGSNPTRDNRTEGRVNGPAALADHFAKAASFASPIERPSYASKNPNLTVAQAWNRRSARRKCRDRLR